MLAETDGTKYEVKEHPTIFYEIIHSDLPPPEKLPKRLEGEAAAILGAGAVTTAWTLTVCLYHLTVNPEKMARLQAEIKSVMPDPYQPASFQQLERLPYLSTCLQAPHPAFLVVSWDARCEYKGIYVYDLSQC